MIDINPNKERNNNWSNRIYYVKIYSMEFQIYAGMGIYNLYGINKNILEKFLA